MNKFIIVDGLPYLFHKGKVFTVRWDEFGFTVGAEVEMASVPDRTYSEVSVKAKCAGNLNSIDVPEDDGGQANPANPDGDDGQANPAPDGVTDPKQEKALEDMSLQELKDYAKANEINLGSARIKADIIEVIANFESAKGDAE